MPPAAIHRVLSLVKPTLAQNASQVTHVAEVGVVTLRLPGQQRVERVVEVVAPLGSKSVTALFQVAQDSCIVQITLCHQQEFTSQSRAGCLRLLLQFRQKVHSAKIKNAVYGVEP